MIPQLKVSGFNSENESVLWSINLPFLEDSAVTLECEIKPKILHDLSVRIEWKFKALSLGLTI